MWRYVKRYLHFALLAAIFMVGEVMMDLIQPQIMGRIVDEGVLGQGNNGAGDLHLIWTLGLWMIALVLFGGLCGSMNNVFVHLSGQNIGNEIRKDAFRKIMGFSFSQMDHFGTGPLVTRVTNDITQVQNFVSQFVRGMIRTSLLMFGSIYFMFRLDRDFGLIVLCAFPFIVGCLGFCLWRADPLFTKLQAQLDILNTILQEDISGIRIIKACVRELYEKARFREASGQLIKVQLKVLAIFAFMHPTVNAMMYAVTALLLYAGSFRAASGHATPGDIMAAITYTTQLLNGILMLVLLFQNISRGLVSWKRVKLLLDSTPWLEDGDLDGSGHSADRSSADGNSAHSNAADAGSAGGHSGRSSAGDSPAGSGLADKGADDRTGSTFRRGEICFRDVSFTYPGTDQPVLAHIDLTIHSGETIAIMGATGCGKTTLISLISRFYDVTEGAVLVDGVDVRAYKQTALRGKIAVALQKAELFSLSIRDEIAWGRPEASMDAIAAAAETAQADRFIKASPRAMTPWWQSAA